MKRPLALCVVLTAAVFARADDGIPAKTLAEIKAATVFVKVETAKFAASGSGFVIQSDKDGVVVVTNEHVVTMPAAAGPVTKLDVVFNSGKAKEEAVYPAEVLAADPERDLAVLRVRKVATPPKSIDLKAKVELSETMTVYAVGFPFGEALSSTDGNPAPTIGKSTVSSLRQDEVGELSVVQLDGGINPGNSGGPVVDNKGRLVGVAVAKVKGTNIGLAIPPNDLTKMLQGRIGASGVRVLKVDGNTAEVELAVGFIDPLAKVGGVSVRVVKSEDPVGKPIKKGEQHPELTGGTAHPVKVIAQLGTVKVKLPLARHLMQVTYSNDGGKNIRTAAIVCDLPTLARGWSPSAPGGPMSGGPLSGGPRSGGPMSGGPTAPTGPLPKATNALPNGELGSGDISVKSVVLAAGGGQPQPGVGLKVAVPCLTWTADGKGVYAIDHGSDSVKRFSFPEMKEEATLSVGKEVSWLSLSSEGLVATVAGSQEAWVLDPKTLKKGTTFAVNKAKRVLSAPSLGLGYVFDSGDGPFGGGRVRVVDLKTGKKASEYEAKDLGRMVGLNTPVLSADGKHLFTTGGLEQLFQFAVDGKKVTPVTASERMVSGAFQQPVVSADGKLAAAPSGGGNSSIKARKAAGYSTFVFMPGNLAEPVIELKTGAYPSAVGFDMTAGLIYAQSMEDQFIVLDREGSKLKSWKLSQEGGFASVVQILPHPSGWKAAVLVSSGPFGGTTAYAVELPKK